MGNIFEITGSIDISQLQKIHDCSLIVLEQTGMKFMNEEVLKSLELQGVRIDWANQIAYIPKKLAESILSQLKKEVETGHTQKMFNGGVAFNYRTTGKVFCKFGSIAPNIFNWSNQEKREATEKDLIESIRLGEAIPEIGMVGCPMYCKEINGEKIDPNLTPIINAMLLAKNTTKLGNSEVNNEKQLKYLIEMGTVLRGSLEEYRNNPCFITAKESISPLVLDRNACSVLVSLAKNSLPAIMIPMPILGASVPVSVEGAMIVCNAEIIATMVALRSIKADAIVGGGSITSAINMQTGNIKFNIIDALKVDAAMAQLYDKLYGLDYGYGIYASDAKFLGPEIIYERIMRIIGALFVKKFNYVIGLYDQGMIFSNELAIIEIDIIKSLHALVSGIEEDSLNEVINAIKNVGQGGSYLGEAHTLANFKNIYQSEVLGELTSNGVSNKIKGMFELANERYKRILNENEPYELLEDKRKEIDRIVDKACRDIVG